MNLRDRKVVVVGLGKSGVAAARLSLGRGADVVGTDRSSPDTLSECARALPRVVAGGHEGVDFAGADLIVVSPGVPPMPELDAAERAGVEVIGEVELASRFLEVPVLAVGGTNGKSTTTALLARLLEASGWRVFAGANLGTPLTSAVGGHFDFVVAELSSFQLERAPTLRPAVSILLNVSEDHLDRYSSFQAYADAKGNAFVNQTEADTAIVAAGDLVARAQAARGGGKLVTFGPGGDYEVFGVAVVEAATREIFSLENADLHGSHNLQNAAAAIAAARAVGASADGAREGIATFRGLPHRTARVGVVGDVVFYDDSKATNVGAAVTALEGMTEPRAVLIAGGRDKQGSYGPLVDALRKKGRAAVLIGEAAERIAEAIGDAVRVVRAESMTDAVARASALARPGDAVILSPACSSFDMFESYADRGRQFADAVARLSSTGRP